MTELLHDRGRDRGKVIDEGEGLHGVMLNLKVRIISRQGSRNEVETGYQGIRNRYPP